MLIPYLFFCKILMIGLNTYLFISFMKILMMSSNIYLSDFYKLNFYDELNSLSTHLVNLL